MSLVILCFGTFYLAEKIKLQKAILEVANTIFVLLRVKFLLLILLTVIWLRTLKTIIFALSGPFWRLKPLRLLLLPLERPFKINN